MNSFNVHTKIMTGGGLETVAPKLKRAFIVTDGFMSSSGKVSYITDKLEAAGVEYRVFDQVRADPDVGTVSKGVEAIQDFKPDAVIAFGGGSPIDAAKAIVFFAGKTCDMRECQFIAVPTTSGTGSEVTSFAVITDPEKEVKYPLVEESLFRGVVFGSLYRKSRLLAYVGSVGLFCVYHIWQFAAAYGDPALLLYAVQYLPVSIALCWLYERTGSVWSPIFLHMLLNGLSVMTINSLS